ncbi:MAG: hypothetical protein EB059_05360 [Alphaproteobacteria bacterium]|nr:hypothetical protein [Alphaproteobacteria bacterium]
MSDGMHQKSTYEIWQFWAKALERQLKRCATVYEEHSEDAGKAQKLLERIELFIDPVAHAQQLAKLKYDVQGSTDKLYLLSLTVLQKIFRDTLNVLPEISEDMQRLLNSPCYGNCSGRQAMDIFKGPHRTDHEGIGAGISDVTGFLPWMLAKLLDEVEVGGDAYLQKGLHKNHSDDDSAGGDAGGPLRSERSMATYKPRKKETLTGIS